MRSKLSLCALVGAAGLVATGAQGALSYAGGSYFQDFDTLATAGTANTWTNDTTLPGWSAFQSGSGSVSGTRDNTITAVATYRAGDGSSNAGALYSFGTGTTTDRALGSVGSGTPGDFVYVLILQNTSGAALNSFTLSYRTEQWRQGGQTSSSPVVGTVHMQVLDYATFAAAPVAADVAASNTVGYTAPGGNWDAVGPVATQANTGAAVDGNAAGLVAGRGGTASLNWNPNEYLVIRWWDDNDTGNDHGIGIDSVGFSAVPTPGSVALLGLAGLAGLRRRR